MSSLPSAPSPAAGKTGHLSLEALEKHIGIRFRDKKFAEEALTHKSYAMERGAGTFNERLEFLGDSVLNTAVTHHLFIRFPKDDEGRLSKLKSQLVARHSLAEWGRDIRIGDYLRLSEGEDATGGRDRESLVANVMEALIGAIFLDQGYEKAEKFVIQRFSKKKRVIETDFKSKLQEVIQKKHKIPPSYVTVDESGPDHDKTFHIEVRIKKKFLGRGRGKSKKEAEQDAAHDALKNLKKNPV